MDRQKFLTLLPMLVFSGRLHAATALFNCGGPTFQAEGTTYQADQLYTPQSGAGAVDGTSVSFLLAANGGVVEGTDFPPLYTTQRQGVTEYRFDVPNGVYLLSLGLAELQLNGPQFRVFTISAEGKPLLPNFDIYATVERNYVLTYHFAVPVTDGQLNVNFSASVGQSAIATIGVARISPDKIAPPVPTMVTGIGGYTRNILSWPDVSAPDLAGYFVLRSGTPDGPFAALNRRPIPVSRYFDDAVVASQTSYYRVAAADVFGNISAASSATSATPRSSVDSTLPVYQLSITPENLATLEADPESDVYVDADFFANGVSYPGIGVRFRGNSSREYEKKSWKITFAKSQEFGTKDKLNEKSDGIETAIFRECLGASILRQTSALVEACGFAHFEVNGEFRGVFNDLENIDQYFLSDHGLNPNGKLFEAKMSPLSNFQILPDYSVAWDDDSKDDDEGYDTLAQLIQTINLTPDAEFASTISSILNVNSYLDYYSSLMLAADFDHTEHNFEMNLNPDSLIWEVIAKDFDANFLQVSLPVTYGTSATPEKFYNSYNILTDRLLKVPLFRQWYVDKLAERLQSDFTTGVLSPLIDQDHAAIEEDGIRDVFKRGREDNTLFNSSSATLKQFITQRRSAVLSQLPGITPGLTQPIELNEVLATNVNGLTDAYGEHDSWL